MRGSIITGKLEGWYGLDEFAKMLQEEGITMGSTKPAPDGVAFYQVNDDIIVTLAGHSNAGYAFSIAICADADTVESLKERLTRPGAGVYIHDPYMVEITYSTRPTRVYSA